MGRLAQSAWIIRVFAVLARARCRLARAIAARDGAGRRARRQRRLQQRQSRHHADHGRRESGRHGARPTSPGRRSSRAKARPGSQLQRHVHGLPDRVLAVAAGRHAESLPTPTSARRRPSAANTAEFFVFYNCTTRAGAAVVLRPLRNLPADRAAGAGRAGARRSRRRARSRLMLDGAARRRRRRIRPFPPRLTRSPRPGAAARGDSRAPRSRPSGVAAARQVSSLAMTTAISLWLVVRRRGRARTCSGPPSPWRSGANPWWYVVGAPLVYLGVLVRVHASSGSRSRGCSARSARRRCGSDRRASAAALLGRDARDRPVGPQHGALSLGCPATRRPRPPARRCCCSTACCAMPASMHDLRTDLVARDIGPVYTMSYGPPLASIELLRRPGRREDRCDPRGDRRVASRARRPQHGRARRPRVSAPVRRGKGQRR